MEGSQVATRLVLFVRNPPSCSDQAGNVELEQLGGMYCRIFATEGPDSIHRSHQVA